MGSSPELLTLTVAGDTLLLPYGAVSVIVLALEAMLDWTNAVTAIVCVTSAAAA
jgi:hypothetical protein